MEIEAVEFKARLSELTIWDIRSAHEIADLPLGGIELPLETLDERLAELEPYRHRELVVICYLGFQSLVAQRILTKKGFTHVRHLRGGLEAFLSI
jgi:rhodanese-related sulfurtransferase